MDIDALRRLETTLTDLLCRIPDTPWVGSPYVEEYERAVDRAAELGIDADWFRVSIPEPGAESRTADEEGHEVRRSYLLAQVASLGSYVRNRLKRLTRRP